MTPGTYDTADSPGTLGVAPAAGAPARGGAGGVVVRAVEPDEESLIQSCAQLVAEVYGGEGLVGSQWYLDHIVADAGRRAREAATLAALDTGGLPGSALPGLPASLLGTAAYVVHGSPYADLATDGEAEMRMLAVARTARGRGIGRLLTTTCIERARRTGHRRFVLSTGMQMAAAQALYRSLGMRRTPERDWSPVPEVTLLTFAIDLV